jgi:fibronectin type 3 domain-containing protein
VRIHYVDTLPPELGMQNPAGFVMYGVEEVNMHGRSAGISNQVAIPVAPTISAPDKVSAEVSADGVHVSWSGPEPPSPPAGVAYFYRVMRRPAGSGAYIVLDDVPPSGSGAYLDKTFAWEQKYEYRITTLTQVRANGSHAAVEGDDSPPVEVFTRDIYPPAQPAGLQAVFSHVGQKPFVDLTWAPNLDSDLAGYNIFRWVEGAQPQKLNTQLVQTPSYRDENVEPGKKYFYAVSAVDLRGNESARSAEATEAVPIETK